MATAASGDWRRLLFGDTLIRPAEEHEPSLCSVDVLTPSDNQPEVLALYFRMLSGPEQSALGTALMELYANISPRLQVVQVFMPAWLGFPQLDRQISRLFSLSYPGVPWYTMPVSDQVKWVRLKHKYRGRAEKVVLLSADSGNLLVDDVAKNVQEDPQGLHFPWVPRTISAILSEAGQTGLIAGGLRTGSKIVPYSGMEDCIKGLYFSARWCPPCKVLTRQLVDFYHKMKSQGHKFEIIFVTSDRSEEAYDTYLAEMPWTALPYNSELCQELTSILDINGIPSLVLVEPDGSIITKDARGELKNNPGGELFPWRRQQVSVLTDTTVGLLYDNPGVVFFLDGEERDDDLALGKATLLPVAEWAAARTSCLDYQFCFFIAVENDACDSLRLFTRLDDACPLIAIIDFPLNRFHLMDSDLEITEHSVKAFVSDFFAGKLTFKQINDKTY